MRTTSRPLCAPPARCRRPSDPPQPPPASSLTLPWRLPSRGNVRQSMREDQPQRAESNAVPSPARMAPGSARGSSTTRRPICGALLGRAAAARDLLDGEATAPDAGAGRAWAGRWRRPRARRERPGALRALVKGPGFPTGRGWSAPCGWALPPEVAQLDSASWLRLELWCAGCSRSRSRTSRPASCGCCSIASRGRSLLARPAGSAHEASLQLGQERGRLRAVAELQRPGRTWPRWPPPPRACAARSNARRRAARHRRRAAQARHESAVLLSWEDGPGWRTSHKPAIVNEAMKLVGVRKPAPSCAAGRRSCAPRRCSARCSPRPSRWSSCGPRVSPALWGRRARSRCARS